MKYSLLLFDFDGTLMDTSEGIFYSARHTMADLGIPVREDVDMNKFVGPPLGDCFRITFGLEERYVQEACRIYRVYYNEVGKFKARFYPHVLETLARIKEMGIPMCLTTMKASHLAKDMVRYFGLGPFMDEVFGADLDGVRTKKDLVLQAVKRFGMEEDLSKVLLVGDTMLDADGARLAGCDFLGVSFGFGVFSGELKHPLMDDYQELVGFVR